MLQDDVESACYRPRTCSNDMSTSEILDREVKNESCIDARKRINNWCFRGGDKGHKQQIDEVYNTLNKCRKILQSR